MKPVACFTIVRDEPYFLRLWCSYYCEQFGADNCFVLDNSTQDGSVAEAFSLWPTLNVINAPSPEAFNHEWLRDKVQAYQKELLESYRVVLFAESDEFLLTRSGIELRELIEQFASSKARQIKAQGWNVVHQIDSEPGLTRASGEHPLEHRKTMFKTTRYNKTLISMRPLVWCRGFHTTIGHVELDQFEGKDDLVLLHLQMVDLENYMERVIHRFSTMTLHRKPHGNTDRKLVEDFFRTGFYSWDGKKICEHDDVVPIDIDPKWKTKIKLK